MKALRLLLALVRWDVIREVRRRECVLNMSLFAFLVLFVGKLGLKPDMVADPAGGVTATVAPVTVPQPLTLIDVGGAANEQLWTEGGVNE